MNAEFFGGLLAGWAVLQVALGGFFVLAHSIRRREPEYLIFGCVCFALAILTAGMAGTYSVPVEDTASFFSSVRIAHFGAVLATAFNLHFALRYVGIVKPAWVYGIYAVAALYLVVILTGSWWASDDVRIVESGVYGTRIAHATAQPSVFAISFYAIALVEIAVANVLFLRAYLAGKREAVTALGGGAVALGTTLNDVLLVTGQLATEYLLPHGFLAYAFAVASTLLLRYQTTAGQLESSVDNLRKRTRELRSSYAELEVVQHELVKKEQLAAVGELAAMIAHEVRNPLAVIMNAVAGLRRAGISDADRETLLSIVDEETARLNRLVTDLLRFARPVSVKRSTISISELVDRAASAARGPDVRVEVQSDGDVSEVSADPGLMRLVLDNLISNSCQAMGDGGTVQVAIGHDTIEGVEHVKVSVTDSGPGMEGDVLNRAIDPFFTTRPSGTGLGLPIVERIIEAHGGSMRIDSEPGTGTTVTLLWPVEREELPALESGSLQAASDLFKIVTQ